LDKKKRKKRVEILGVQRAGTRQSLFFSAVHKAWNRSFLPQ
jgi:hypothetical protein